MIPGPTKDFEEVGDKLRTTVFEVLAPASNRLLSAYLPSVTLRDLAGKAANGMDIYGMVEVPRQAEYQNCTPEAFEQVLKSVEPALGRLETDKFRQIEQEMQSRLKLLDVRQIEMSPPQMLGGIFKKDNAAGFAMLMNYKLGDHSVAMAGGTGILRVKNRLLFVYLFQKYESPDTVAQLRQGLEVWVDSILASNK